MRQLIVFTLLFSFIGFSIAGELPDFSGKWRVNPNLSDDVKEIFKQHIKVKKRSLGSGQKKDGGGLLFGSGKQRSQQLRKLVRKIPPELLKANFVVVQQTADTIHFDYLYTSRTIRTDGRSNPILLSTDDAGARDVVTGVWDQGSFEVEIVSALGAHVEEIWQRVPAEGNLATGEKQIEVVYTLDMPLYLEQKAKFRRVFDWVGQAD